MPKVEDLVHLGILEFRDPSHGYGKDFWRADGMTMKHSAAASAVSVLEALSNDNLFQLRNVSLCEDQLSIVNAAAHPQGLIPFCLENPQMRIERIVDLWKACISPDMPSGSELWSCTISRSFGQWILETLELQDRHGMPPSSFRLVIDGGQAPKQAAEIFGIAEYNASFQDALDLCYQQRLLARPSWLNRRHQPGHLQEGLSQTLRDIRIGELTYLIGCDLELGPECTPETIFEQWVGWSEDQWREDWDAHRYEAIKTEEPLPPWNELSPLESLNLRLVARIHLIVNSCRRLE